MIGSATISAANPGGKGDAMRSRDCAGSCHGDSSTNGISSAVLDIVPQQDVFSGQLIQIDTLVGTVEVSSLQMVGLTLLSNKDGAKDLPSNSGWQIVTDPNGGTNNYVEIIDDFSLQTTVSQTWTLRAPQIPGFYELYLGIQHGSPEGGVAMVGISESSQITVREMPENRPSLAEDWTPPNVRDLGEATKIELETVNTTSVYVEMKLGAEIVNISVVDNFFTIPAAINPGVVEWRAVMQGEGPDVKSPWFRLTAQEKAWDVDKSLLYLQALSLFLLCLGLAITQRQVKNEDAYDFETTEYDEKYSVEIPAIPSEGIPEGWTMEQWEYYGQEHLDSISRGDES